MLQMIAEMETAGEACKRAEIVRARIVPVSERSLAMPMRAIGAEIK